MTAAKNCPVQPHCLTQPIWQTLKKDIYQLLANKTLADITTL
ncbi:MAG: hypothetical protein ACD_43C00206G0001 [uncultured bacterium]|nr:MAG: hypothetical protein ACD_43C00206G0001 [uncultured bacterium]